MFAVMKDSLDNELAHRSNDVVINSHSLGFGQAMVQSCDGTNDYDQKQYFVWKRTFISNESNVQY